MKILLTGANGQLGFELWRSLQHFGEVIPTTRKGIDIDGIQTLSLDLSNKAEIERKLNTIQPGLIVNAAAYTAVDQAESDENLAFAVNTNAPAIFARYAKEKDIFLTHYSTDYVFSGNSTIPWIESDHTNPLGVYGESKLMGEQNIIDTNCKHMIFRTAWIFSERGKNFLNTMLALAKKQAELKIIDDQIGSPTWAYSLAVATSHCLISPKTGIFHMTSNGKTSWYGFAKKIFSQAKKVDIIEKIPNLLPINTEDYYTLAKRPTYSVLNGDKLKNTFNLEMPNWQNSLKHCIQQMRTKI